ncbi:MAG: TRAP transporter small permease [Actinomycetota bacterium]
MTRFNKVLTAVENVLAAGTLGAAVFIAALAIVLRAVSGVFLFWSEEAVIYLIIFSTFLGAVITLRESEHVNVDIIPVFLGRRGKKYMAILASLITIAYLGGIGFFAWRLIFEPFSFSTITPALKLPLWAVELAVPIGFTLMFYRAVEILVRTIRYGAAETTVEEALEMEAAALGLEVQDLNVVDDENDGKAKP